MLLRLSSPRERSLVDEHIRPFHIAMNDAIVVQEAQTFDHLLHVALDLIGSEPDLRVVKQAIEIMLAVLEDQEDGALLAVIVCRFGCDNFLQFDDAGMVEFGEQLNLADGGDWELYGLPSQRRQIPSSGAAGISGWTHPLLFVAHIHLLKRHHFSRFLIGCLVHGPVAPEHRGWWLCVQTIIRWPRQAQQV